MAGKMTSIWSRRYHLFANDKLVRQSGCRERERETIGGGEIDATRYGKRVLSGSFQIRSKDDNRRKVFRDDKYTLTRDCARVCVW